METNFKRIFNCILISGLIFILHSCKTLQEPEKYINLDYSSYTFESTADTMTFIVKSNVEWEIAQCPEWATAEKKDETSLKISVNANSETDMRNGTIEIIGGNTNCNLTVYQMPHEFAGKFKDLLSTTSAGMTRNGKYIYGLKADESGKFYPWYMDIKTETVTEYPQFSGYDQIYAMNDDASTMVLFAMMDFRTKLLVNGEIQEVRIPEGYNSPNISAMSADGTVWVGYAFNQPSGKYYPVRWTNGEPEILDMPDVNAYNDEARTGSMARGCSADGSIIYGSEWSGGFGLIYWVDGKMYFPGVDYAEKKTVMTEGFGGLSESEVVCTLTMTAENTNITSGGTFIATRYEDYIQEEEGVAAAEYTYASAIDTRNGEMIRFERNESGLASATLLTGTDDGIMFGATPASGIEQGYVFDLNDKACFTISEWFKNQYGINIGNDRMVTMISTDGNIYFGGKSNKSSIGVAYNSWYYVVDKEKL